ncbi:expressed unknown protein [Seminavis robusta]|uniref:Uncharacterized protein n=1 Tax=Seminavis robusta TaxID=568900 RepID=A0A9N8DT25_9STRA|nr:expressed unknown protein [Seminavis robusta]|eukprot:Sro351_g123870.1 n/a (323) ;mRNA; r:22475-23443
MTSSSPPSMQFSDQTQPFEDDASWGSVDAIEDLLADDLMISFDKDLIKDSCGIDDDDSIQGLLEQRPNLTHEDPVTTSIFSPDKQIPTIAATVSHGSSFDNEEEPAVLMEDDIQTLLKSDIMDDNITTFRPKQTKTPALIEEPRATEYPVGAAAQPPLPVEDSIHRILLYLHYNEHDRTLVHHAQTIVQTCIAKHQKRTKNPRSSLKDLSGKIFEGWVNLFGGPRFHAYYRNAMAFTTPSHDYHSSPVHEMYGRYAPTQHGPHSLELAIAYGMHLARFPRASGQHVADQLREGMKAFNSMSEDERRMFWDYMMNQNQQSTSV